MNSKGFKFLSCLSLLLATQIAVADHHEGKSMVTPVPSTSVDNTAMNERDSDMETVLPEDQSNESVHLERTRAIRASITEREDVSTNAHNIKIITLANGVVVLRGPVNSMKEKDIVESLAKKHAGGAVVKSFIEVKK
jgi:osmotically-inducible protein OsmY